MDYAYRNMNMSSLGEWYNNREETQKVQIPFEAYPQVIPYQLNPLYLYNYYLFDLNMMPMIQLINWIYDDYLKQANCVPIMTTMVFELLHLMFATNSFYFFVEVNFQRLTIMRRPFGLMFIFLSRFLLFSLPVQQLLDSDDDDYYYYSFYCRFVCM